MATKRLSDLPVAGTILGTETIFGLQNGNSVQIPYGSFNGITTNSVSGIANSTWSGGTDFIKLNAVAGSSYSEQSISFQEAGTDIGAKIGVKNKSNGGYDIIFANRDNSSSTSVLTERLRITASGNVGIGTNSPSKQLSVYTSANSLQIQSIVRNANTGTGIAAIGFNVADLSEGDYTQAGIGLLRGIANGSGSLCFYNKGSGTASNFTTADEKMRIDSSGNVTIQNNISVGGAVSVAGNISLTNTTGLSSPTSRFNLTKTSQADYHITSTTSGASATNTLEYGLTFAVTSGTQAGIIISENGADGTSLGFYNTNNYDTGPQLRMSIESAGVVIIPAGKLYCPGQVVQTIYSRTDARTTYAFPATNAVVYLTDNFATITPKFSNSGIYIQWNPSFECQYNSTFRLFRSIGGVDTEIGRNTLDAGAWSGWANPGYDADTASTARTNHHIFMDYPATTAAVTYKFGIASSDGAAGIYNQNRTYNAVGQSVYEVAISQTILQEITV